MDTTTMALRHGKAMYINGLQHAINMFKIGDLGGYPVEQTVAELKKRIAEVQAELEELKKED